MALIIKNISSVSFIESRLLSNTTIIPGVGACLNFRRDWRELPTVGLSECSVTSSVENKSRLFKTKLSAFLSEHFDVANRRLCFLAKAVDGSRYLIGAGGPPYPVANTEDSMPASVTGKSGCSLTVELTDTVGLLPVID